jgi:hypothetical protein
MGYFGCCFNYTLNRVAWDKKMIISNKVRLIIFKSSGFLGDVILKRLRWVQMLSCPSVTRHSTTKLRVAEWRCNYVSVTSTRVRVEPSSALRCGCAYGRKNCWFWTWWRSDKFLFLPGIEPLITSRHDFKDISASAKTGENDGKIDNQSRDTALELLLWHRINLSASVKGLYMWISVVYVYFQLRTAAFFFKGLLCDLG